MEARISNIEERLLGIDRRFDEMTKAMLWAMDHMHKDLSRKLELIAVGRVSYQDFYELEGRVETLEKTQKEK